MALQRRVVIVGIGNLMGGDDGIGSRAVARLAETGKLPPEIRVLDAGTIGLELLASLEPDEAVVLLDAVRFGATPGTIHRVPLDEVPEPALPPISVHDLGVPELLLEARALGRPLRGVLLGVEPERIGPFVGELSAPVAAALPNLERAALREARRLAASG